MKMPGIDQSIVGRRATVEERLRRIVEREWVLDSEADPHSFFGLLRKLPSL
jgi:hypothetical protein